MRAIHGVYEEEHSRSQRFVIDVDLWLDAAGFAAADDYDGAVCYEAVYRLVAELAVTSRHYLIEALAQVLAEAILARFAGVEQVRVTVHKPDAPLPGPFADVGVAITRGRRQS